MLSALDHENAEQKYGRVQLFKWGLQDFTTEKWWNFDQKKNWASPANTGRSVIFSLYG
jgi:hypothetical protein